MLQHFLPPPAAPATQESPLTPRETDVLRLIAKGLTIADVGDMLGISRHTASGYVKDVYRKLSVNSRAEAALEATRLGLVGGTRAD
jgi:DNA-binding CsgD family transcriptional regulator